MPRRLDGERLVGALRMKKFGLRLPPARDGAEQSSDMARPWWRSSTMDWLWGAASLQTTSAMSQVVKAAVRSWASPLATGLAAAGIRANTLTMLGLLLNIVAALMLASGAFAYGGLVF